ncbi:MAG TPA: ATP-binding protein [Xanthobacteraceae bacterium]|nr:ATP-binding protein [Xanthobacteraceae bacterium]
MPLDNIARFWSRPTLLVSVLLGLAIIGLTWFGVILHLNEQRSLAIEAARQNTGNLARTFEQQIIQIIEATDKVLLGLQSEYEDDPGRFDFENLRRFQRGGWKQIFNIIGPNGELLATSEPVLPSRIFEFNDRDYFRVHVDDDRMGLFISKPIVGRFSASNVVVFSRRLSNKDGSFAGVIAAYIYPDLLVRFYETIDVGKEGAISLWRGDGSLLAARGFKDKNPTVTESARRLVAKLQEQGTGFYIGRGRMDGITRQISFRRVASFPLVVTVALSEQEILAIYRRDRIRYFSAAAFLTAIVLVFVGFIAARERRIEDSARAKRESDALLARANLDRAESEERLAWAMEATGQGIWELNLANGNAYMSPCWKAILGYADDELVNNALIYRDLLHPADRAAAAERLSEYRQRKCKSHSVEFRLRHKSGDYRWLLSKAKLTEDSTRLVGTIADITARKQAEEVIAQENERLERLVTERTAKLQEEMRKREEAQRTLFQAQKMETVGQLTAGVAHDFNNLLAVINGGLEFIELAAKKHQSAEPELIEASIRAGQRGKELVQQLLTYSRQAPLQAKPTIVDQLVLDTLQLLQRTIGESIEINIKLNASGAGVLVDRGQWTNALINLAINARDAMPEGGKLTIATVCQRAKWADKEGPIRWPMGEEVCISVSDTGHGMTEEVLRRATEPFFTTKPDGLGTGLGLSMVHGFVEQSGGHIELESEVDRGATITIRLPRIDMGEQQDQIGADPALLNGNQKTVLLVEDDVDVRTMTTAQLKELGYKVRVAADGKEALNLVISPASFDVLMTDVVLPFGMDGLAIVRETLQARPKMAVLCISGYAPSQKKMKWIKAQNIAYLEKPFSIAQLADALEKMTAH